MTGSGPRKQLAEDRVDRGVADRDGVFQDVQGTGDGIGARRIAGAEQRPP